MASIRRLLAALGTCFSIFALGGSLAFAAPPTCSDLAAYHVNAFYAEPMESMGVDDTLNNPCTGVLEGVSIEFTPGLGFVQGFENGDIYAEVDPYVMLMCEDGRAFLRNAEKNILHCDTR